MIGTRLLFVSLGLTATLAWGVLQAATGPQTSQDSSHSFPPPTEPSKLSQEGYVSFWASGLVTWYSIDKDDDGKPDSPWFAYRLRANPGPLDEAEAQALDLAVRHHLRVAVFWNEKNEVLAVRLQSPK